MAMKVQYIRNLSVFSMCGNVSFDVHDLACLDTALFFAFYGLSLLC